MRLKLSLVLAFLVLMTGFGASAEWSFPNTGITYGNELQIDDSSSTPDITCDPNSGSDPECLTGGAFTSKVGQLSLRGCQGQPDSTVAIHESGKTNGEYHYRTSPKIPNQVACGFGGQEFVIYDGNVEHVSGGEVFVQSSKSLSHRGKSIRAAVNVGKGVVTSFFLTNNCENYDCDGSSGSQELEIKVAERDRDVNDGPDDDWLRTGATPEHSAAIIGTSESLEKFYSSEIGMQTREGNSDNCYTDNQDPSSHDACDVLDQKFTDMEMSMDDPDNANFLDTNLHSPAHNGKGYRPDGEIGIGYIPEHYNDDGLKYSRSGELYFHVCGTEATMSDKFGEQTELVFENGGQLYRCDTSTEEWAEVTSCGDGLDNDGDGNIDLDDPNCDVSSSIEGDTSCPEKINFNENDVKTAYYDGKDVGGECQYSTDKVVAVHEPQIFTCEKGNSKAQDYNTDLSTERAKDKADYFCSNIPESSPKWHGNDRLKAAQYFIQKKNIPTGKGEEVAKYVVGSDNNYPNQGFKHVQHQTLHDAEKKYACPESICDLHAASTWEGRNMEDIQNGYDRGEYVESWTAVNFNGENTDGKKVASSGTGGFVGKCKGTGSTFQKLNGQWKCSEAELPVEGDIVDSITTTFFNLRTGDDGTLAGDLVGFRINQDQISKLKKMYKKPYLNGSETPYSPMEVDAQCFLGGQGDPRPPMGEVVNISVDIQEDRSTWVVGRIPSSAGQGSQYTCVWGLNQVNADDYSLNVTEGRPDNNRLVDTQRVEKVESDLDYEGQQQVLRDHMNEMSKFGRGNLKQSTRDPDFNPFKPYTSIKEAGPGQVYSHPGDWYYCKNVNSEAPEC